LAGGRAGPASALDRGNGDATFARAVLLHAPRKAVSLLGRHFKDGLGIEDADGPDGRLGDATGLAEHRQQPARLGLVLAAERDLEPGATLETLAGTWVLVAGLVGDRNIGNVLGCRTGGELLAKVSGRDRIGRMA